MNELPALLQRLERAGRWLRAARAAQIRLEERDLAVIDCLVAADSLTPGDLGRRLGLSTSGVAALVSRLEQRGYVERLAHPRDGRKRILLATLEGRRVAEELVGPVAGSAERAEAWLSPTDRRTVAAFLDHVSALREAELAQLLDPLRAPRRAARGDVRAPGAGEP